METDFTSNRDYPFLDIKPRISSHGKLIVHLKVAFVLEMTKISIKSESGLLSKKQLNRAGYSLNDSLNYR